MMRLRTYAGFSLLAMIAMTYHAFNSRGQFYLAMVYLYTSKLCFALLLNMGLILMCILWQLVKLLFLGALREAEVERLNEQLWREMMEILFAITIFRQDFSVTTLAMITALLMIKSLHWLAQKRVDHIETTPSVSLISHVRIVSFLVFLLVVDFISLQRPFASFIQTKKASVTLFFLFEYTILASTTISTLMKYVFYVTDLIMDGQWEKKAVFTFYLELIRDLFNLSLYILFFLAIFANYGLPLHLIRELYETFRSFKIRIADYIRYRRVTSNVDERFPNATPEELNLSDATCIICREEMVTAKKLLCGHLFHVHCLKAWLERQNICPTCRALVIPPDNGSAGSAQRPRSMPSSTSTHGPEDVPLSPHQARLKAAAVAASIYEKSFIYPPSFTSFRSAGYSFTGQGNIAVANNASSSGTNGPMEGASASDAQDQHQSSVTSICSLNLMSYPEPSSADNQNATGDVDPKVSTIKARETFIQTQIELLHFIIQLLKLSPHCGGLVSQLLENELQALKKQKQEQSKATCADRDHPSSDVKGKSVVNAESNSAD